jgi:hypothetical protein
MTMSDETLMAYADGELDGAARAAVESAMRDDPQIEKRVEQHRALRRRVQGAYSAELSEDVPEHLLAAARGGASVPGIKVVSLRDAREAIERKALRAGRRPQWRTTGSIAASVILGLGLGYAMWGRLDSPLTRSADGAMVARGPLAKALSNQLAAEQLPVSAVRIGVSFLAKSGDYCRTFVLAGKNSASGLACRHGAEWQVVTLAQEAGAAGESEYRTAGSGISATILQAVEGRIAGEPLDQSGERAARQRGWKGANAP